MRKFFKRVIQSLASRARGLAYLAYNIWASRALKPIFCSKIGDYTITGLRRDQIHELDQLHRQLRNGRPLSYWRRALLKYKGSVLCGIVADQNGKLLGFHLSQFLKRDFKRGIVHLEFASLLPEARGKGLAGASRLHIYNITLPIVLKVSPLPSMQITWPP